MGSNDRLNFAVIGLNGRAYAHLSALKANRSAARISHVCDVESNILKKFADSVQQEMGEAAVPEKDFRRILEQKNVDAITIATPDHWHTPMAIAGLQAGKHVFLYKAGQPQSAEGAMLVQAQQKYRKLVTWGPTSTLRRIPSDYPKNSGRPPSAGRISRRRGTATCKAIRTGKGIAGPAPTGLDLWEGPAPRRPYTDNVQPDRIGTHDVEHLGPGPGLPDAEILLPHCRPRAVQISVSNQ